MSIHSFVIVALMAFVLLGPTLMVAVLVSGLSRRAVVDPSVSQAAEPTRGPALETSRPTVRAA